MQMKNKKQKAYKKSKQYVYNEARCNKRHEMFQLYTRQQEQQQDYAKNKLLPIHKMPCLIYRLITGATREKLNNAQRNRNNF